MDITRDGNVASVRVGNLWLAASGWRPIADGAWREYLEASAASVRTDGPFYGVLFWAPAHGPSARQRKMLTHEFAEAIRLDAQKRVALISESALVRGTITAINWFARKNDVAFSPKDVRRALEWLAADIAFDETLAQRALDEIIVAVRGSERKGAAS